MKIDVPCRIQLTGTPMHHTVGDWVVQTEWLFVQVADQDEMDNHGPRPLDSVVAEVKHENITMEEAYSQIKDIVWPCVTILGSVNLQPVMMRLILLSCPLSYV